MNDWQLIHVENERYTTRRSNKRRRSEHNGMPGGIVSRLQHFFIHPQRTFKARRPTATAMRMYASMCVCELYVFQLDLCMRDCKLTLHRIGISSLLHKDER